MKLTQEQYSLCWDSWRFHKQQAYEARKERAQAERDGKFMKSAKAAYRNDFHLNKASIETDRIMAFLKL